MGGRRPCHRPFQYLDAAVLSANLLRQNKFSVETAQLGQRVQSGLAAAGRQTLIGTFLLKPITDVVRRLRVPNNNNKIKFFSWSNLKYILVYVGKHSVTVTLQQSFRAKTATKVCLCLVTDLCPKMHLKISVIDFLQFILKSMTKSDKLPLWSLSESILPVHFYNYT